jgi:hypothetical protein
MSKNPDSLACILGGLQLICEETKHAAHIRVGSLDRNKNNKHVKELQSVGWMAFTLM